MGTEGGNVPPRRERPTLSRLPDGKAPASGPPAGAALRDRKPLHSPAGHAETAPFDDEEVISKFIKMSLINCLEERKEKEKNCFRIVAKLVEIVLRCHIADFFRNKTLP